MFYRANHCGDTEKSFIALMELALSYIKKAHEFVETLGSKRYLPSVGGWGGVTLVEFEKDKVPKDWIESKHRKGMYYPRRNRNSTKQILEEIEKLPTVKFYDLGKVVGMNSCIVGNRLYEGPTGNYNNDEIAVFVVDEDLKDRYKRPQDVTEITSEEYDRLVAEIKKSYDKV